MALTRPASIRPFADTGLKVTPADGAMNTGLVSVARLGYGTFNFLLNYAMNGVRYLARAGIATWLSTESYVTGDIQADGGVIYRLTGSATVGLAPHLDSANWAELVSSIAPIEFGDFSEGDLNVTGATTISGFHNYRDITIGVAGVLTCKNPVIRCRNLTFSSGGRLRCNGDSGAAGGVGTDTYDFVQAGLFSDSTIGGGANGGIATTGSPHPGDGFSMADYASMLGVSLATLQNNPDVGFDGGSAAGGAGGFPVQGGGAGYQYSAAELFPSQIRTPGWVQVRIVQTVTEDRRTVKTVWRPIRGGAGGGGGGASGDPVIGGAGGGALWVFAQTITMPDDDQIECKGGDGQSATASTNTGAGGGGGGRRTIVYQRKIGAGAFTTAGVSGGAGGAGFGGGTAGSAGPTGLTHLWRIP